MQLFHNEINFLVGEKTAWPFLKFWCYEIKTFIKEVQLKFEDDVIFLFL